MCARTSHKRVCLCTQVFAIRQDLCSCHQAEVLACLQINQAYEILSDDQKRQVYDMGGMDEHGNEQGFHGFQGFQVHAQLLFLSQLPVASAFLVSTAICRLTSRSLVSG